MTCFIYFFHQVCKQQLQATTVQYRSTTRCGCLGKRKLTSTQERCQLRGLWMAAVVFTCLHNACFSHRGGSANPPVSRQRRHQMWHDMHRGRPSDIPANALQKFCNLRQIFPFWIFFPLKKLPFWTFSLSSVVSSCTVAFPTVSQVFACAFRRGSFQPCDCGSTVCRWGSARWVWPENDRTCI